MQETLFVWLGSKRAKKRGVGEGGVLLDLATRAGLPVPNGGILLDDFYRLALEDRLLMVGNGRVTCPDPDLLLTTLYEEVRFPKIGKPVVVRSTEKALPIQYSVNFLHATELSNSLCQVYSAAQMERRDVIVMERVEEMVKGTAVIQSTQPNDQIHYQNKHIVLPQLHRWQRSDANVPLFAQRLQKLLRGIRRTFGQASWHIEWADDGHICWLMQMWAL